MLNYCLERIYIILEITCAFKVGEKDKITF